MDLRDLVGEPRVADRAGRGCPLAPGAEAGRRDIQHPAGDLDGVTLLSHHRGDGEPAFWGHRLLQQFLRAFGRGELGLEGADAPPGRREFTQLGAAQSRGLTPIDPVLLAPVVDAGTAHAEVCRDLCDAPADCEQVQDLPPELRWIPSWHAALP